MDAIENVRNLETQLAEARKEASRQLAAKRAVVGLTLRQVAKKVRKTATAVYNTETGKTWDTKTAAKIDRVLENAA